MPLFPTDITAAAAAAATPVAPVIIPGTWDRTAAAARNRALSTTTDLVVPGMVRPYLPHQAAAHEAAMAAIAHYGYAVLADDMGLGKTQVMLGLAAEHITQGGYVIMIAPPVTKAGYMGDLAAAFPHLRFAHLHGRKADFANLPIADVYWLTDDAPTMKAWLTRTETRTVKGKDEKVLVANAFTLGAKFLTRDEMHRDKGSQGKATTGRAQVMMAVGAALRAQGTPDRGCHRHAADQPHGRGVRAPAGHRRRAPDPGHHARCQHCERIPVELLQSAAQVHPHRSGAPSPCSIPRSRRLGN